MPVYIFYVKCYRLLANFDNVVQCHKSSCLIIPLYIIFEYLTQIYYIQSHILLLISHLNSSKCDNDNNNNYYC